ncbi:hypothetical protein QVD17_39866 [Tagetes erecta]|uniref:PB1 domain-containing protein n=1 Tax=Tagetes erecta TaxID=13708 RepID=A0AAD8JRA5_TARER|nr:hypothetical protein QVD17_39866 [Tagetes erecta]
MNTITIKASYREDIIRFRVAANSGIVTLKEEVAKRLKLDVGTFDLKYLDDDHERVLIACDSDLQECVELSGCNMIRLLVHDFDLKLTGLKIFKRTRGRPFVNMSAIRVEMEHGYKLR